MSNIATTQPDIYIPVDITARQQATDIHSSCIVTAPAGSGKTGLLTLRVLKLLAKVSSPEEILCITFTRKAAGEMRERIFSALETAESRFEGAEAPSDRLLLSTYEQEISDAAGAALRNAQDRSWNLMQQPFRLNISTIDGYCKQLCAQLPFFSGLSRRTGIIEQPEKQYEVVVKKWLEAQFKNSHSPNLVQLIEHFSGNIDRITSLLAKLLSVRDQWLPLVVMAKSDPAVVRQFFEQCLQQWLEEKIATCEAHFLAYETDLLDLVQYAHQHVADGRLAPALEILSKHTELPSDLNDKIPFWRALAKLCLTGTGTFRKTIDKNAGFLSIKGKSDEALEAKEKKSAFLALLKELAETQLPLIVFAELSNIPDPRYSDTQWKFLSSLVDVLPELAAYLKLHFSELQQVDFTEFSLSAVSALNACDGDVDIQQRLDYRLNHILIDEFQDTSQTQLELLTALTREWVPDDGRTLFIVGDGMQSCYSFRNANVGIFLTMREHGLVNIPFNKADLSVNFRSTQTIIDWVNNQFTYSFPIENNSRIGAVKYSNSIAGPQKSPRKDGEKAHSFVKLLGFDTSAQFSEQAHYIAKEIADLRQEFPDNSIAVLARSRPHLVAIIQQFKENQLPYQAVEIDRLRDTQYIVDLLTLCRLVQNPSDKIAWLAFLRGPWCALTHNELFKFFNPDGQTLRRRKPVNYLDRLNTFIDTDSCDAPNRLRQTYAALARAIRSRQKRSFSDVVELLWITIGGPEALPGVSATEDVLTFFGLVNNHQEHGLLNQWDAFESALDKLYANPSSTDVNPIQLMTMHKSKGLEFDTVFLPSLQKRSRSNDAEALYWLENSDANQHRTFALSPIKPHRDTTDDPITKFMKNTRSQRETLESNRLFYVACTRAKQRLYLCAELDTNDDGEFKPPASSSLLGNIWAHCQADIQRIEHAIDGHEENGHMHGTLPQNHTPEIGRILAFPNDRTVPFAAEHDEANLKITVFDNAGLDVFEEFNNKDNNAIATGVVFHRVLNIACKHGWGQEPPADLMSFKPFWKAQLQQHGVDQGTSAHISDQFYEWITTLLNDEKTQWLLDPTHKSSAAELEIIDSDNRVHIIDRTFIEHDTRWIVDYKTSTPSKGESTHVFIEHELANYTEQLQRYRDVMRKHDTNTLKGQAPSMYKTALYFPFVRLFVPVESLDWERPE